MKIRILSTVIAMMAVCMNADAQGASNLFASFSPMAGTYPTIHYSPDRFTYKYKNFWLASIGYSNDMKSGRDKQKKLSWGPSVLTELTYGQAKYDQMDFKGIPSFFDSTPGDLSFYSWNGYLGYHITKSRVGISALIGPGFSYMHSGPFHNLFISPCAKVRLKAYVTNKIGLFVGGGARYDIGFKDMFSSVSVGTADDGSDTGGPYRIGNPMWNLEAGIVLSMGAFYN